nr:ATP-binding protein [Anoxybacillus sp. KU2-6(11)]
MSLANFKNHATLEIEFGDITNIQGRNGAGKSSIGDAITWLLYGTDIMGNKLEPKPIGEDDAETKLSYSCKLMINKFFLVALKRKRQSITSTKFRRKQRSLTSW